MRGLVTRDPLNIFLSEVSQYPVLSRDEERALAIKYYEDKDLESANKLVVANLRFVVKIASEYVSYGFPMVDLIQEGTMGLMKAIKKFNPHRGYRLISYAVWWIKAKIQSYIMKFWSQVKIGTTQAERKLFQKISKAKKKLNIESETLSEDEVKQVAELFGVKESEVIDIELRTASRDFSLDSNVSDDGSTTYLESLADESTVNPEDYIEVVQSSELARELMEEGLETLTPREKHIIESRYMAEPALKLRELADELGISKERVRQLEVQALNKLRGSMESGNLYEKSTQNEKEYRLGGR